MCQWTVVVKQKTLGKADGLFSYMPPFMGSMQPLSREYPKSCYSNIYYLMYSLQTASGTLKVTGKGHAGKVSSVFETPVATKYLKIAL